MMMGKILMIIKVLFNIHKKIFIEYDEAVISVLSNSVDMKMPILERFN